MADYYRALVSWGAPTDLPRDRSSNTLYFENSSTPPTPDYDQLAEDIAEAYGAWTQFYGRLINVRMYNMQDQEPRPIRGEYQYTVAGTPGAGGPREVALCLSYYGERNLPHQRGRIYTGPFSKGAMDVRPTTIFMNEVLDLGKRLAAIGGENISWRVYSPTTNNYHHIRNIWVNNEWDTVRSRGLRGDARVTAEV